MSKIIKAVFTGRFCTTRRVFQFDTDDKLQIVNLDLPSTFTVDFANSVTGTSVPVLATSDTVQIPPELFVPGSEIYAWVWISDTNGGYSKCQATIPIDPRAQRTGASPTPAEASAWDQAVEELGSLIEEIPDDIAASLEQAKESGLFDGPQGEPGPRGYSVRIANRVRYQQLTDAPYITSSDISTGSDTEIQIGDVVIGPRDGSSDPGTVVYLISGVLQSPSGWLLTWIGSIKGSTGNTGSQGPAGQDGKDGKDGADGVGVPSGGTTGQVLKKASNSDYDTEWANESGGSSITVDSALSDSSENPVQNKVIKAALDAKYAKPSGGIPATDLASGVQTSLSKADTALQTAPVQSVNGKTGAVVLNASDVGAGTYSKPSSGIPKTDLASAVQTSLGKADTAYQKPSGGIPGTDLASGVVPQLFEITCTPTALDYSGTMNKTPQEIAAAYARGDRIVATITNVATAELAIANAGGSFVFWAFDNTTLVVMETATNASTYSTQLFNFATDNTLSNADQPANAHATGAAIAGKLDANQGSGNAGKFLVVGNDGMVAPVTMSAWQGGNY